MWNYYRDEPNHPSADDHNTDHITVFESFKYKAVITGKTIQYNVPPRITDKEVNQVPNSDYDAAKISTKETEIIVSLKHLSNFWRTLDMPLINCEVYLTLTDLRIMF